MSRKEFSTVSGYDEDDAGEDTDATVREVKQTWHEARKERRRSLVIYDLRRLQTMLLKMFFKTIQNKKLVSEYGLIRRACFGYLGFIKGIYSYYSHKRDSHISAYVNYFVVREIMQKDPLEGR